MDEILWQIMVRNESNGQRIIMDSASCGGAVEDCISGAYQKYPNAVERQTRALSFCMMFHDRLGGESIFGMMPKDFMHFMEKNAWLWFS